MWRSLKCDFISNDEISIISSEVFMSLYEPMLPPPVLRREPKTYPTIVQDFLAHSLMEPSPVGLSFPSESEMLLESLYLNQDFLLGDIKSDVIKDGLHKNQIACVQWNLKRANPDSNSNSGYVSCELSYGSTCFSSSDEIDGSVLTSNGNVSIKNASPIIFKLFYVLKQSCKAHILACKDYFNVITEATELLSEYCLKVKFI